MLLLAADENFNGNIVRGPFRRQPALDLVWLQDVGLSGASYQDALAWAAQEGRVLLTHDVSTITRYAYDRIQNGEAMQGCLKSAATCPSVAPLEELLLLAECSLEREWEGQVRYLPLR